MSSEYLTEIRNTIRNYRDKKHNAEMRVSEVEKLYGSEAAGMEAERLTKQLQNERYVAEKAIVE